MNKRCWIILNAMLWSVCIAAQIHVPWHCGFEESESAETSQWVLNAGTPDAKDQWYIGNAVRSEGKQSLYISTTSGTMANYGDKQDVVMAYRILTMPQVGSTKEYDISFDFRMQGANTGTLYVFFDNASKLISGTTWENVLQYASSSSIAIPTKVLENARFVCSSYPSTASNRTQAMSNQPSWKNVSIDAGEGTNYSERFSVKNAEKPQALVFVWVNRNTNPEALEMGACIDNIQISSATVQKPTDLKSQYECADSSITISWKGGLEGYMVEYRKSSAATWRKYTYNGDVTGLQHEYKVSGLKDGNYDFRVWGWKKIYNATTHTYDLDSTGFITLSNVLLYCPENMCINFIDLANADCTYGPNDDIYKYHQVLNYGSDDVLSIHTVNSDQELYDPRTNNGLKIVPDGAMASVRLGNWYCPSTNKSHPDSHDEQINGQTISYSFVVDSANAAILLLNYTMVFEESGHDRSDQPYFKISILDEYGTIIDDLCGQQYFYCPMASDESEDEKIRRVEDEGWQMFSKDEFPIKNKDMGFNSYNIWWKPWSTMGLNLSDYDGQKLTVLIESRGCGQSAHYGYGYFTLSCASATLETDQCGNEPTASADAPEGFNYQWFAEENRELFEQHILADEDGNPVVVSSSASLTVMAGDDRTYICHISYKDSPDCSFELSTVLSPRDAFARHTYQWLPQDCENKIVLSDESRVINYGPSGSIIVTGERCDYSQWSVRSLVTGQKTTYSGDEMTVLANLSGDTLEVTHTAFISDGACDNTLVDTIIVGNILTPDSTILDTICSNQKYSFAGQEWSKTGVYTDEQKNQYGCDSITILNLQVNPTSIENRVDTISSEQLPFVFEGWYKGEWKRYEVGNLRDYIASDNYVLKLSNQYNCDSTINMKLTIIPLLKIAVDSLPVLCADGQQMQLDYHITQGDFDSLKISFSEEAHQYGMRDTVYIHDPYTSPILPPVDQEVLYDYPNSITPNVYNVNLTFYQHPVCGTPQTYELPIDVRYAKSIIEQKWNDILALTNDRYNGGYTFSSYQWYKNSEPIVGETKSYLYAPTGLDFSAAYSVLVTRQEDKVSQFTCEFYPSDRSSFQQSSFPTLLHARQSVRVQSAENTTLRIYNSRGKLYSSHHLLAGVDSFIAPGQEGCYIVQSTSDSGQQSNFKIIVSK